MSRSRRRLVLRFRDELAFDPYSALLANAPQAMQDAKGTAQNTEALPLRLEPLGMAGAQINMSA